MEIGECELAQGAIHRIAEADTRAIRLADGAPVAPALVERDHVVIVSPAEPRRNIHNERPLAGEPKRSGSEQSAFNAVRFALAQDAARRHMSIAPLLPIHRERVQKILYLDGSGKSRELCILT